MKPRNTALTHGLTTATTASAFFALQHHADAGIIYSGVQNITASFAGNTGGGATAPSFNGAAAEFDVYRLQMGPNIHGAASMVMTWGGPLLNSSHALKKLAAGALISAGQNFAGTWSAAPLRKFQNGVATGGTWASNRSGFAGFQAGPGNLGWVRLKWTNTDGNPDPNTLTVADWAYNDTPGESILAGDTGIPTPEPSSTALLALAAAGAASLRRRRQG
jgi:hypothetical protein